MEAKLLRLRAEQQNRRTLEFPGSLADQRGEEVVDEALETQRKLFDARWRAYDSSVAIIRQAHPAAQGADRGFAGPAGGGRQATRS